MKYRTVIDSDGVVNHYPILTKEEKEEKNQEFLKFVHELIQKYNKSKDKNTE